MGTAAAGGFRAKLSPERERALVRAAARGDQAARDELVEAFTPLIANVARRYVRVPRVDRAEVMQEGIAGLLEAVRRYNPDLGTPFWAYAVWWVRRGIQRLVAQVSRPVVLSDPALRKLAWLRDARSALIRAGNAEPTSDELAASSGLSREQVDSLLAADRASRGLDEPSGCGEGSTLAEAIADPLSGQEYDHVFDVEARGLVRRLAEGLGDRERTVVCSHYGIGGPARTLRELGDGLGVSAERVRQIEERALAKLRDAFEAAVAGCVLPES
jgi:RNA polymerase sigma factor (sigma-70 family)